MCELLYLILFLLGYYTNLSNGDIFLVSPGDGNEFVYSPVDVNATLHCTVNNTHQSWDIEMLNFENTVERLTLDSRGIFQTEPVTSSTGVTTSSVTVLGRVSVNNNSRICCQSVVDDRDVHVNCTVLTLYDRPASPKNVRVDLEYSTEATKLKVSWRATEDIVVVQNYTLYFISHKIETTQLYYIHQLDISRMFAKKCGEFLAFITAVNGAGESDPSKNVTIPSLPDIGPVTTSLSHQVWKSAGGEIMVNVSFEPATYCREYPLLGYTVILKSLQTSALLNMSINFTETKVVISPQDGLQDNQRYEYAVSAHNRFGDTTSHKDGKWKSIFTSDVQSVIATVVGESTIDIQCLFIHGSDAVGCKVVLVSGHPGVNNETETLLRKNSSAFGQLNLILKAACYHRVLAYTSDVRYTTNDFYIEETLFSNYSVKNTECSDKGQPPSVTIIIIVVILLFSLCLLVVVLITVISLPKKKRENEDNKSDSRDDEKNRLFVSTISTNYQLEKIKHPEDLTQNEAPPLQDTHPDEALERSLPSSHTHSPTKLPLDSVPNTNKQKSVSVVSTDSAITSSLVVPLYAVPEKDKTKRELESNLKEENVKFDGVYDEENFYHVLENNAASSNDDVFTSVPPAPELHPPLEKVSLYQALPEAIAQNTTTSMLSNEIVGGNLAATDDSIGGNLAAQTHTVPVYAVPDKVRSKNKSVLSQSTCDGVIQNESDEKNNAEQEHIYHILENTKAPCKGRATPPDFNAPDLPPPFKPGTPSSDPEPVYQDITEINTKQ